VSLALVLAVLGAALPSQYVIPGDNVFPEGVTLRPGTDTFYVSSTSDGTIYRGTLDSGRMRVFLGPGRNGRTFANGLRASRDHLVVAGSATGRIFVYDLPGGRFVRRFETGSGGLVNDVAFAPNGDAYATDSRRGLLFRIPARALTKRTGPVPLKPFLELSDTPVGQYANGVVSAGERYLLVVGTASGALVRIDLKTKRVREVRLSEDDALPAGDGLARRGSALYVVNSASRVTKVLLAANWLSGAVRNQITSPRFRFPTTVQIAGRRLLVVNSQFDKRGGTPELPFTLSAVRRPGPKQAARPPAQGSP
jgi:Cu-Zn family superoxide dismutase